MPRKTLGEFVRKALAKGLDPGDARRRHRFRDPAGRRRMSPAPSPTSPTLAADLPAGAPVTIIIGRVGRRHVRTAAAPIQFPKALAS